jgi:hypothetical protein
MATGYGLDGRDLIMGRDKSFSLLHSVQTVPSCTMATGDSFFRVKSRHEADYSRHLVPRSREKYLHSPYASMYNA